MCSCDLVLQLNLRLNSLMKRTKFDISFIIIIAISLTFLIDTRKCSSLGPSLLALWGTIAVVFLISEIVVGVISWKIMPGTVGRLMVVAVHGVSLLVTYIGIALGLLVAFNC